MLFGVLEREREREISNHEYKLTICKNFIEIGLREVHCFFKILKICSYLKRIIVCNLTFIYILEQSSNEN